MDEDSTMGGQFKEMAWLVQENLRRGKGSVQTGAGVAVFDLAEVYVDTVS